MSRPKSLRTARRIVEKEKKKGAKTKNVEMSVGFLSVPKQ